MLKLHFYNHKTLRHLKNKAFITVASVVCAKHTVPILFKHTSYVKLVKQNLKDVMISKLQKIEKMLILDKNMVSAGHYLKFNLTKQNYSMSEINKFCIHFLFIFAQNLMHVFYMKI